MSCAAGLQRREDHTPSSVGILAERAEFGLWIVIASNLLFALTDLRLAGDVLGLVYLLKLLQIGGAFTAMRLLRHPHRQQTTVGIILAVAATICFVVAVSGGVTNDVATTMILNIAFAWGTATLLPWGMLPQCAVVLISGLSMLTNVYLVHGDLSPAIGYPTVAVAIALSASLFLVYEFQRHRRALALESDERTRAEEARSRSEADFRSIFEHLEDVFYRTDLEGTIQLVSPSAAQYGYRIGELIGRNVDTLYQDPQGQVTNLALLTQHGALRDFEMTLLAKDGRAVPVSVNVHLVRDDHGHPVGVEGMLRDITDRKHAAEQVRQARDALGERVRERTLELESANEQLQTTAQALRASEQRFRTASELTSDYAYCVRINPDLSAATEWLTEASFNRMTGFTTAEVAARGGGMALIHPDDLPIAGKRLETLLAGRPDTSEFRIVMKDGTVRWVREHGYPEWDAQLGRVIRIYGAAQDITLRRRVEKTLHEQERFVSAVLDTVGALVAVVDRDGRIVRYNRACERTFGYAFDEVRGRYFWELTPMAPEAQAAQTVFHRLLAGQWPTTYDTYWSARDGERRWLAWSTTFLTNDQGAIEYVIGTGLDITDRKRADEALHRSEEHWRALIEQSTDLIGVLGADATIRYLSPSSSRLLGDPPDQWVGHSALELIHPDDAAAVTEALQSGLEHRDTGAWLTFRVRHRDGSWRVFEGTDTNLLENDAVHGIVVNLHDVTERRTAEDALLQSEAHYRLLFDSNPCPLAVIDSETLRFRSVNAAATRHYGYSREEFLSMAVTDIWPPDDGPAGRARTPRELGTPAGLGGAWTHRTKSGALIEVEITATTLLLHGREAVLVQANDVTERRAAEREISRLNADLERRVHERTAQLEAANDELESFSYSVSHDLQAPLRHVRQFAQVLVEDHAAQLDSAARHCVERLQTAATRMEELIGDLLRLSRVARDEMHTEQIDLSRLAHEALAELRTAEPGREVESVVAPQCMVHGDRRLLRVALQNLLGNAWKYTGRLERAHIEFGATEEDGVPVFFVRDNGAGFDMTYADRLFRPFQRLHERSDFEGTGIGLATVQRIIRRHGGRIWADAAVDRGATFYFTLGGLTSTSRRRSSRTAAASSTLVLLPARRGH